MIIKFTETSVTSLPLKVIGEATLLIGTQLRTGSVLKAGTEFTVDTEINGIHIVAGTDYPFDLVLLHDYLLYGVISVPAGSFFTATTIFMQDQYLEVSHAPHLSSGHFRVLDTDGCDDCYDHCETGNHHSCCSESSCSDDESCCDKNLDRVVRVLEKVVDGNQKEVCILEENCCLKLQLQKCEYEKIICALRKHCKCDDDTSCSSASTKSLPICGSPCSSKSNSACGSPCHSHKGECVDECFIPKNSCHCKKNCINKSLFSKIISNVKALEVYCTRLAKLTEREKDIDDCLYERVRMLEKAKCVWMSYPAFQRDNEEFKTNFYNNLKRVEKQVCKLESQLVDTKCLIKKTIKHIEDLKCTLRKENFVYKNLEPC